MNIHSLYRPFLCYFRAKRMRQFCRLLGLTETTRVLDIGGDFFNWTLISTTPSLTIVNLYPPRGRRQHCLWVVADGCHLPFKDNAFDITYSNSVIEHLGSFSSQQTFAREAMRVGVHYFVQTPNKRFPMEPHFLTPFVHWLPRWVQKRIVRNCTVWGLVTRPSKAECERFLDEICLLDYQQMNALFPQARVLKERVLGIAKSLIAVK